MSTATYMQQMRERSQRAGRDGEHPVDREERQIHEYRIGRHALAASRFRPWDDPVYVAVKDEVPIHRNGELHIALGKQADGTWRTRCGLTWEAEHLRYGEPAATCAVCLRAPEGAA